MGSRPLMSPCSVVLSLAALVRRPQPSFESGVLTPLNIDLIPVGDNPPESLNVIIEVPVGGEPVKYEFDKKSGALFVDRILHTPMRYPANYGFVPHTLSPDGDPLDALVIARSPFIPGCVVRARPIGVLNLEDEHGGDEKLICVPVDTTFPYYSDVGERQDLPSIVLQQIEHFFTHYKDLESEKWVRVGNWGDAEDARRIVREAIEPREAAEGDRVGFSSRVPSSAAAIALLRSAAPNGFASTENSEPRLTISSLYPVASSTGTSGRVSRIRRASSTPLMPGMTTSETTRSMPFD